VVSFPMFGFMFDDSGAPNVETLVNFILR